MAIIEVFPNTPTAIQDAVTLANPGEVILVHKGIYYESVQIPSEKSNLRIVANSRYSAILDGRHFLIEAFLLNNAAGVEIEGFKIKNYLSTGIRIFNGKSNRVIHNKISDINGSEDPLGIFANNSPGNLFMKNTIEQIGSAGVGSAIRLSVVSGTWVIQNKLKHNSVHGIEVIASNHNAIVSNQISKNKGDGIMISQSDNNLLLANKLSDQGDNGVNAQSTNNYILKSKIKENHGSGVLLAFNYNLAGFNEIKGNHQSGIAIFSDFNDIQGNKLERNDNNGVFIHAPHTANFVFDNQLKDNNPQNIKDLGENNNIIQNKIDE
ncbi:hypothetical protein A8709_02820 [Paenibacillus pectinilyticus]|uniref:Right handed beta helix domain-containing protein n=1 Tax=Paenibacillus pectinilyticus TaxID=512399 RepID=A0A1C1A745_9BACL|nr:right-handed parallel beta-helix repeat-containing protein [Paenibacillus pectinilyticus]OCT16380.1 hypothetical protein A8709_02820 [Paenibacillus pectinilyticus]